MSFLQTYVCPKCKTEWIYPGHCVKCFDKEGFVYLVKSDKK